MRTWLIALWMTLLGSAAVQGQSQSFPDTFPVSFRYSDTLKNSVVMEPGTLPEDGAWLVPTQRAIVIKGAAPLTGFDITQLDEDGVYNISIGNFDSAQVAGLQGRLRDDENYDATKRAVNIPLTALNYDGDEVTIGRILLNWNTTQVTFEVTINNGTTSTSILTEVDYDIGADFYRERDDNAISTDDLTAAFTFGPAILPFSFELRTVYTVGTASTSLDERVVDVLSDVSLNGAIDSIAPQVAITTPAPNAKLSFATTDIVGTVSDKREIGTTSYPGSIQSVEVQVSNKFTPGTFVDVAVTGNGWILPNVTFEPGENTITVRATDGDGNATVVSHKVTYLTTGPLTVQAIAEGYPVGASGVAGVVNSANFSRGVKSIEAVIAGATGQNVRNTVESGQQFKVTAVPKPGSVFNGWTASVNGNQLFTAVEETLTFETLPNLVLEASFVPNPFPPVFGAYHGLISGDNPAERGTFAISISNTGAFTGKVQIGALTLPLKGKVLGSGYWQKKIVKGGKEYTVEFELKLGAGDDRLLEGTVTGGGLSAEIAADLKTWRKAKKNDAGNLATAYAGTYTAHIRRPQFPVGDPPDGIGYAQISVSPLGVVKLLGKLGDGTPVKASTTLVQRNSGPVFFPLYIGLDKKRASFSGEILFAATANSDLAGTCTWQKPPTAKVEPQAFHEECVLTGARYTVPIAPSPVMLVAANGTGRINLYLPPYDIPVNPPASVVNVQGDAQLSGATQTVLPTSAGLQALALKMKFAAKTGLFTGSYKDPDLNRTITFSGIANQKANGGAGFAGGVVVRGNQAGSISFGPATP
jgi:hypothetical protein